MGKLAICGDCAKAFEPDNTCPFCANKELTDQIQVLKNNMATVEHENKRLREDLWQERLKNHQNKKSAVTDSDT